MKTSPKLVLALLAAVSCAAGADTYSSQADQARRERNREEALASYRAGNTTARQDRDAVEAFLAVPDGAVAGVAEGIDGEGLVRGLQLLQTDDVGP